MIVFNNFNQGRLGNQLFFVAATIGIANNNKTTYGFTSNMGYNGFDYQNIFKRQLPLTKIVPDKKYHQEKFSHYDIEITEDVEIIGYFQSEKFFIDSKDLITKQFEFKDEIVNDILIKYPNIENSASIHVRRGDYLNQLDHHPVLPLNYYNKFISNNTSDCEKTYVFSDDEEWCKKIFIGDRFIFPKFNENNDLYSFILLSLSKKIAISNSTYSWWASWLNKNKNKEIYCFQHNKWFGKIYSNLDTMDTLPKEWNIIEYD
jgi:hypothetical protein